MVVKAAAARPAKRLRRIGFMSGSFQGRFRFHEARDDGSRPAAPQPAREPEIIVTIRGNDERRVVRKAGSSRQVLVVGTMPDPEPELGEVRIRVAASGIN